MWLTIFIQSLPQLQPRPPPLVIDTRPLTACRQEPPVVVPVAPLVGAWVLCVCRRLPVQLEPELVYLCLEIKEVLRRKVLKSAHHPMASLGHEFGKLGVAAGRLWPLEVGRGRKQCFGPLCARCVRLLFGIEFFGHFGGEVT